jgi:hypothetical protein
MAAPLFFKGRERRMPEIIESSGRLCRCVFFVSLGLGFLTAMQETARATLITGVSYGEEVTVGGTIPGTTSVFLGSGLPLHTTQSVISSDSSAGGTATYDFTQTDSLADIHIASQYTTSSSCGYGIGEWVSSPPTSSDFYFTTTEPLEMTVTMSNVETVPGGTYGGCSVEMTLQKSQRVLLQQQNTGFNSAFYSFDYQLEPNVQYTFYTSTNTGYGGNTTGNTLFDLQLTPVPEPGSLCLLAVPLVLSLRRRGALARNSKRDGAI